MRRLVKHFLQGSLVLLPVMITVYLGYIIIDGLDRMLFSRVGQRVTSVLPLLEASWFPSLVGVVTTLLLVTLVGFFASNFLGKKLVHLVETLFERLPFVRVLYTSIRDLLSAFVGEKKRFQHPVLVALVPDGTLRIMGFVTRDSLSSFGHADLVSVYVPQSYNFAGNLLIVPRSRITTIDASTPEVMAFIVSGGVAGHGAGAET